MHLAYQLFTDNLKLSSALESEWKHGGIGVITDLFNTHHNYYQLLYYICSFAYLLNIYPSVHVVRSFCYILLAKAPRYATEDNSKIN